MLPIDKPSVDLRAAQASAGILATDQLAANNSSSPNVLRNGSTQYFTAIV